MGLVTPNTQHLVMRQTYDWWCIFKHANGGRWRTGCGEHYSSAMFPAEMWSHYEVQAVGNARKNKCSSQGWHWGLQALFPRHHLTLCTFMQLIKNQKALVRVHYLCQFVHTDRQTNTHNDKQNQSYNLLRFTSFHWRT